LCCYTHPKKWPQWGMLLLAIPISKWQLLMCAHCTRMTSRRWEMPLAKASLLNCWLHEGHLYNWQNLHLPFILLKDLDSLCEGFKQPNFGAKTLIILWRLTSITRHSTLVKT
jgi:hypothetical protein